jgi:uncharacterized membrane protein
VTAVVDRARRFLAHPRTPFMVLVVLVVAWAAVMGAHIVLRHERFGTPDWDEGIFDQFFWLLAHGRQFNTVRGVTLAGHHASFAFLPLAPLTWLGAGPNTWNVIHALTIASTAIPLFLLARDKLGSRWLAFGVGVVWLVQPTPQWLVHEGFHPEGMSLPFLVGTYLFGERMLVQKRESGSVRSTTRWAFIACFALTITWKEDLSLALLGMGLMWLIRREWRLARGVIAVSAVWFVVFGLWLVPHFAGGSVYGGLYGELGETPGEVVANSARHPGDLVELLRDNDAGGYARDLGQSWGFVSVASPTSLLIGLPQWFTSVISTADFTRNIQLHYAAIPLASLAIGFVEGMRWLQQRRWWSSRDMLIFVVVVAALCSRWYGVSPLSIKYRDGYWPLVAAESDEARRDAVDRIPDGAGVVADYRTVPHLTHREIIYSFPNPWVRHGFGVNRDEHGDPAKVDWVLVDERVLGDDDEKLFERVRDSGEFAVRLQEKTVTLLERIKPPGEGDRPLPDPRSRS